MKAKNLAVVGLICFGIVVIDNFLELIGWSLGEVLSSSSRPYPLLPWMKFMVGVAGFFVLLWTFIMKRQDNPKGNDTKGEKFELSTLFWPIYFSIIIIVFFAAGVKLNPSKTGLAFRWDLSQAAFFIPVLILLPFLLKAIVVSGGILEAFGVRYQINRVRKEAENADDKAKNVAEDLEHAIDNLSARIADLEEKRGVVIRRKPSKVARDEEFSRLVDKYIAEYRKASPISDSRKRIEIDKQVKDLPKATLDEILGLKDLTPEHEMIEALLLNRFAQDPSNARRAFEQLISLAISGRNSRIRYRAAISLGDRNWIDIIPPKLRRQAVIKLNQRAEKEPNETTANELWDVAINLA